jgi:phosphate/sulfate permease
MSTQILLLAVLGAITISAYMSAINARGVARIAISYFLATVVLAATVYAIIQHVEQRQQRQEKIAQQEKLEEMLAQQQEKLEEVKKQIRREVMHKQQTIEAARDIERRLDKAVELATFIANVNLTDRSLSLNELMDRAQGTRTRMQQLKTELNEAREQYPEYADVFEPVQQGIEALSSASQYFYSYYHAETSAQESRWENQMRANAQKAHTLFKEARSLLQTQIDKIKQRDST